ncbi:HAD-like domain-containing protein [Lentinula lateritia]|nr:HAD-like domain-containing protein [Lentinula lateritia]
MPLSFHADAVLFDMDGTLTDSIAAVEAAWGKVAKDLGQDPAYVIAATHGKRAIDNLAQFKPQILPHQMESEVQNFEESILFFADAFQIHGPGSRRASPVTLDSDSAVDSEAATPSLTPGSSATSSRASSFAFDSSRRPSFAGRLSSALMMSAVPEAGVVDQYDPDFEDPCMVEDHFSVVEDERNEKSKIHQLEAWQIEAAAVDRSVRILPGVKKMIDSIPAGRYAVATSGAKTYAYGCMTRVGIIPPPVTITADDKRLRAGKPAPDPFLLAAKCLGYDAKKCVVFEDSPSGIRAGVASGATVIAVCTSHERSKIENCGAHFVVENMEKVKCELVDEQLHFTILE